MPLKGLSACAALALALVAVVTGMPFAGSDGPAFMLTAPPLTPFLHADLSTGISSGACDTCGWIESHRGNQYTVRMRDGSSRVFHEERGVQWRLGERLIYID